LRWVVEGSFALVHWSRRLRIRWEIRDDIHGALLELGCALIGWRLHHSKSSEFFIQPMTGRVDRVGDRRDPGIGRVRCSATASALHSDEWCRFAVASGSCPRPSRSQNHVSTFGSEPPAAAQSETGDRTSRRVSEWIGRHSRPVGRVRWG
jgi:hypothetical protein